MYIINSKQLPSAGICSNMVSSTWSHHPHGRICAPVPAAMISRQTPLQGLMFSSTFIYTPSSHSEPSMFICSSFQGVAFDQPRFFRIYDIKLRREELTNEDISFFVFKSQLSHKYNTWVTTKLDSYRILPNHHKRTLYYIRI